jgi:hypothetical protein
VEQLYPVLSEDERCGLSQPYFAEQSLPPAAFPKRKRRAAGFDK